MGGRRDWRVKQGGKAGTNRQIDENLKKMLEKESQTPVTVVQKGKKRKPVVNYVEKDKDGNLVNKFPYKKESTLREMTVEQRQEYEVERMRAETDFERAKLEELFG